MSQRIKTAMVGTGFVILRDPATRQYTFTLKQLRLEDYQDVVIETDHCGSELFRLSDRAHGSFSVSQMSAGSENRLKFETFGDQSGRCPGTRSARTSLGSDTGMPPNHLMVKDRSLLAPEAARFADLP